MRPYVCGAAILLAVLALCIGSRWYVESAGVQMRSGMEQTLQAVEAGDYEQAETCFAQTVAHWETQAPVLTSVLIHEELNALQRDLTDCRTALAYRDEGRFAQSCARVCTAILDLAEMERLTIGNIL